METNKETVAGNAAKLPETLERIIKCQCANCPDHGPLGCEAKHRIGLCKLFQSAREILSAPPRNCDLHADFDGAWAAYRETTDTPNGADFCGWLYREAGCME